MIVKTFCVSGKYQRVISVVWLPQVLVCVNSFRYDLHLRLDLLVLGVWVGNEVVKVPSLNRKLEPLCIGLSSFFLSLCHTCAWCECPHL